LRPERRPYITGIRAPYDVQQEHQGKGKKTPSEITDQDKIGKIPWKVNRAQMQQISSLEN